MSYSESKFNIWRFIKNNYFMRKNFISAEIVDIFVNIKNGFKFIAGGILIALKI